MGNKNRTEDEREAARCYDRHALAYFDVSQFSAMAFFMVFAEAAMPI